MTPGTSPTGWSGAPAAPLSGRCSRRQTRRRTVVVTQSGHDFRLWPANRLTALPELQRWLANGLPLTWAARLDLDAVAGADRHRALCAVLTAIAGGASPAGAVVVAQDLTAESLVPRPGLPGVRPAVARRR